MKIYTAAANTVFANDLDVLIESIPTSNLIQEISGIQIRFVNYNTSSEVIPYINFNQIFDKQGGSLGLDVDKVSKVLTDSYFIPTTGSPLAFAITDFPKGQETMANSMSVTIASDQSPIPITGTITATGVAQETTLQSLLIETQSILTELGQKLESGQSVNIGNFPAVQPINDNGGSITIDGTITANIGTLNGLATELKQDAQIVQETAINTVLGTQVDAAAGSDTGTFSIISFIKRTLQNWTSFFTKIPTSLGQKTMANSFAVVLPSDQSAINVAVISNTQTSPPTAGNGSFYSFDGLAFSYSGSFTLPNAGVDNNILLIKNPIGSGKLVYLQQIHLGCTVNNIGCYFKLFANPIVITNGTTKNLFNNRIGHINTASSLIYEAPTTSSFGSQIRTCVFGQNTNSLDLTKDNLIIMEEGQSMLITGKPDSNNRAVDFFITLVEI